MLIQIMGKLLLCGVCALGGVAGGGVLLAGSALVRPVGNRATRDATLAHGDGSREGITVVKPLQALHSGAGAQA
ncbi:hypothetical protein [Novosphingobium pokkalii]|uniref:Uncharacterized protein n=1 Tax=Novosphingobium pokkalii TaxID=1770194 RepID=A0ABV7V7M0_9SPHN|nr:hypothetical protein [Novosphingobium pokkalii]